MAVSIITSPPAFAGLHAPIWHVVLSDQVLQPNFRYVFYIKIDGNVIATLKVLPDDSGLFHGVIDVSRVLRSYIRNYFDLSGATPFIIRTDSHSIEYTIDYAEEYGGPAILYPLLTTSSHTAYNSYAGDTPGATADAPSAGYVASWLTDHPMVDDATLPPIGFPKHDIRMPRNGNYFLSYMNVPPYSIDLYMVEVDDTGAAVSFPEYTLGPLSMPLNGLLVLNLNLEFINAAAWSTASPLPTSAEGYKLFIDDGTAVTPLVYVRWMCEPKVNATPLHFMNRHGGFDTYYFTGPTRKNLDTTSLAYEKIGMVKDLGTTPREYIAATGVYADTQVQYNTKHNWTRKLSSGYVDDATHEWLWQLLASPQVYFEQDGFYYPVRIKTQNWTEKLNRFDKMYNLELEITMGRNVRSQSR